MDRNLIFDLADVVSQRPHISHEEAKEELGLSDEDFAAPRCWRGSERISKQVGPSDLGLGRSPGG